MSIEFNKDVSGIKPGSNDEKKIIIVKPQADPAQIGKLLGQKTGKLVKEVSQEELLKHLQELIERQTQQAPEYEPSAVRALPNEPLDNEPSAVRVLPNEPPAKRILPYEPLDNEPPAERILPYEPWEDKPLGPNIIGPDMPPKAEPLPYFPGSPDMPKAEPLPWKEPIKKLFDTKG